MEWLCSGESTGEAANRGRQIRSIVAVPIEKDRLDCVRAMNSPEAGKSIPKTVVMNPKTAKIEMIIPYIGNRGQRIEELKKVRNLILK